MPGCGLSLLARPAVAVALRAAEHRPFGVPSLSRTRPGDEGAYTWSRGSAMPVIEARELVKDFPVRRRGPRMVAALGGPLRPAREWERAGDHATLPISQGEAGGCGGPKGGGKSPTIKLLTGLLWPTEGEARVMGLVSSRHRTGIARQIGVVFGQRTQLWWDLPVADSFELLRDIYAVPSAEYAARRDEFVELLDLGELLKVPVRQLSLGQRMRAELVAALLHGPAILHLDEPTIGLDEIGRASCRERV